MNAGRPRSPGAEAGRGAPADGMASSGSGAARPPVSARALALDVLHRVLGDAARPLEDTFQGHPRLATLTPRDRAFARLLCGTVLRRMGQIDQVIDRFLRFRPRQPRLVHILRLGAAQLLFLDTPPHAAVTESVALALPRHRRESGMINAVLRKIAAEGKMLLQGQDAPRLNTPEWLFESWQTAYGAESAHRIASAHLVEPPLDLSVKSDAEVWARRLDARILPTGTLRRTAGGLIADLPGYGAGAWWVQDAAAALPARFLGDVGGKRVLDIGAAPGGKTAQLAAAGAHVTALEIGDGRAERLRTNLARLNLPAEIVVADAAEWRPDAPFPFVLLDAPCTATGTIRRHPDVARHKTPADVARLAELQARLLDAACAMLAPGGVLVYASCSLQPEEGPEQIATLLARHGDLVRDPISPAELAGLEVGLTPSGELRSLPCDLADQGGLDGFYAARIGRPG